ncbi:hypothetical protein HQ865_06050 [Mucilaginibacter mali]|uniref:Uncharacterized protein n=1 Tax=Mucilaginibacter mali TaxID=2740462 RepID=A0A7D4TTT5_9SPHI|nr:hypothetical protein [Mucilaginibacter mali]QKJ29335.1 hypothetical protein HQ865_06050 [Mucilaginibacter mali]
MYWYKQPLKHKNFYTAIALGAIAAFIASCRPEIKETKAEQKYFDLKGYFRAYSARLSIKHPLITKTVMHNGESQTKKVYIDNWGREFELFENSDINKPAWRDSYETRSANDQTIYQSKDPDLKTTRIVIKKTGDRVNYILIYNHTKNLLYENVEKLSYFPDSAYQIDRTQTVRLLGKNVYSVKGVF